MSIRKKLIIICGIFILSMLALSSLVYTSFERIGLLKDGNTLITRLEVDLLMLRRNEKDFLSRKDLKYQQKFIKNTKLLDADLLKIRQLFSNETIELDNVDVLWHQLDDFKLKFEQLVYLQQQIGLTPTKGLYGQLRNVVHQAEQNIAVLKQPQLLAAILMLRRHEKDFMLRNNQKYIDKFTSQFAKTLTLLNQLSLPIDKVNIIEGQLQSYRRGFIELTQAQITMGLKPTQGVLGELRTSVHLAEDQLVTVNQELTRYIKDAITAIYLRLYSVTLMITVITLFGIIAIIRSIQVRISTINKIVSGLAEGEVSLQGKLTIDGNDEITLLANNFNLFIDNIHNVVTGIITAVDQLSQAASEIDTVIVTSCESNERQFKEIVQANVAMSQMKSAIDEIAKHALDAASSSTESNEKIKESLKISTLASNSIFSLAKNMQSNTTAIEDLNQESENIGSVLQVICDIAEQTNLLALNAAIEAARAGESGRGFSVVADEVRNLAQRTQTATEDIRAIIESLQLKAQSATNKVKAGVIATQDNVKSIQHLSELINKVGAMVSNTAALNNSIAVATEEQTAVSSEICQNIARIDIESVNSKGHSQTLEVCRGELFKITQLLDSSVEKFRFQ